MEQQPEACPWETQMGGKIIGLFSLQFEIVEVGARGGSGRGAGGGTRGTGGRGTSGGGAFTGQMLHP